MYVLTEADNDFEVRRQKFRSEGKVIYEWEQSLEDLIIYITPPKVLKGKDMDIRIQARHVSIGRKGSKVRFIDEDLVYTVKVDQCFWSLTDGLLEINLTKMETGKMWPAVFVGHMQQKMNIWEEQNAKKAMMLERFSRENPHFDFSNAKFSGHNIPDANSFMDGIDMERFHK